MLCILGLRCLEHQRLVASCGQFQPINGGCPASSGMDKPQISEFLSKTNLISAWLVKLLLQTGEGIFDFLLIQYCYTSYWQLAITGPSGQRKLDSSMSINRYFSKSFIISILIMKWKKRFQKKSCLSKVWIFRPCFLAQKCHAPRFGFILCGGQHLGILRPSSLGSDKLSSKPNWCIFLRQRWGTLNCDDLTDFITEIFFHPIDMTK